MLEMPDHLKIHFPEVGIVITGIWQRDGYQGNANDRSESIVFNHTTVEVDLVSSQLGGLEVLATGWSTFTRPNNAMVYQNGQMDKYG